MKVHSKYDSKEHGVQYNVQVRTRYPTHCTVVRKDNWARDRAISISKPSYGRKMCCIIVAAMR